MLVTEFEDKETHYAYNCIRDFFDNFGLSGAVADLDSILKVAISSKTWKKTAPFSVIFYMEKLEELCAAAFVIHHGSLARAGAILEKSEDGIPDMLVIHHFAFKQFSPTIWEYFPRNLTASQYQDPYKAIKKFVVYRSEQEWKKIFKAFTEYALSKQSIDDTYPPYNILTVRRRLLQLIEACHLLDVRTNIKKDEPNDLANNGK